MSFNIQSKDFYDTGAVDKELRRVFDICHGCRRCFNLCPSFPALFDAFDRCGGEVDKVTGAQMDRVVDLCYQCKLCYPNCPYTPPHRWDLDFPRLMLRAKAARGKVEGISWRDKLMGRADLIGRLGGLAAPLANWAMRFGPNRWLMEKVMGIHRDRNLPQFHTESFEKWFQRHRKSRATTPSPWPSPPALTLPSPIGRGMKGMDRGERKKVALFYTCSVNHNNPEIGRAAVLVLEKNGFDVLCPKQECCGMPSMDCGDIDSAVKAARENAAHFRWTLAEKIPIVSLGPTCGYMLRQEYPNLSHEALDLSRGTKDICEFLMEVHKAGKLSLDFKHAQGTIAYHLPCHLKATNIGYKSRDLMGLLPQTKVNMIERCSGHDGTWAMKTEFYKLSMQVGKKLFDEAQDADQVISDCPLAGLQIRQGTRKSPKHPIEVLRAAYGL